MRWLNLTQRHKGLATLCKLEGRQKPPFFYLNRLNALLKDFRKGFWIEFVHHVEYFFDDVVEAWFAEVVTV